MRATASLYPRLDTKTFLLFTADIRNWIRNIEQHASEGVNKILIGNKSDMLDKKVGFQRAHFFLLGVGTQFNICATRR